MRYFTLDSVFSRTHKELWSYWGLLLLLVMMAGCGGVPGIGGVDVGGVDVLDAAETAQKLAKGFQDISPEQEYYIGRAVGATVAGQYKVYENQDAANYINELGQTLAQASDRPETFRGYHFLILDSDEINAFAAPGGFIFITRGMLRCAEHEDAVAAVLAHEIAHVQHKHGLQSIKKSRISSAMTEVAVDSVQSRTDGGVAFLTGVFEESINDITTTMVTNGYSRAFEREADNTAVIILRRVGYNPNGLIDMLSMMKERLNPGGKDFARTHPSPESRIKETQKFIGEYTKVKTPASRQVRFEAALKEI